MNAEFTIQGHVIETDRLLLRAFKPEDFDDFHAYGSQEGVAEMAGWSHKTSEEESREYLDLFIAGDYTFAIFHREDQKVIGSFGVKPYQAELEPHLEALKGREIGFVLAKEYWGQGLIPEAIEAVSARLFKDYDFDFLLADHFDSNQRSARVLEKCGFKPYRKEIIETALGPISGRLMLQMNPYRNS